MRRFGWVLVGMVAAVGGCYQAGGPGQSGLSSNDHADDLADAERSQLCDWGVEIGAVTGTDTDCGVEVIEAPTREECEQGLAALAARGSACPITVASIETCWQAMADDPCVGYHASVCDAPPGCE